MIKLSDMLIATLDDKDPLIALQINEAKRLEVLDVPQVKAERKPLVDEDGDPFFVILDHGGVCVDWELGYRNAERTAKECVEQTGYSHHVCQVLAPVNGECPTVPVATLTPERPHEWVVYRDGEHNGDHWMGIGNILWFYSPNGSRTARFATAAEAQAYIDTNGIQDAYPWPVPKLTS